MYNLITLTEVKRFLNISGVTNDDILTDLINDVTMAIELFINQNVITRQYTEYHDGLGKTNILVNHYPIYKVGSLYDDTERDFSSDTLIASDDMIVDCDPGVIALTDDEVSFAKGSKNVKVVYYAGYSRFLLVSESNNYIDIKEDGGSEVNVEIPAATPDNTKFPGYNAEDLATAIQTALNDKAGLNFQYAVSYNHDAQKFTISTGTDFQVLASSGASVGKSVCSLIGISPAGDTVEGQHSVISDNAVNGVPNDLRLAAKKMIAFWLDQSGHGKGLVNVESQSYPAGQGTTSYITDIPDDVKRILDGYMRIM